MNIISIYPEYLQHFTRNDYPVAFEKFKAEYNGFFAGLSDDKIDGAVSQLMFFAADELSRKIGRRARCFDLSSFLCVYICPAALEFGTGAARDFAFSLAESWNKLYPEFSFEVGGYEDIATGFRTKPFGF